MTSKFVSHFKTYMEDMLNFKEALGYSRDSYEYHLSKFDNFCKLKYPEETGLIQKLVLDWARIYPTESINGLRRRLAVIRALGEYMKSIGVDAYVIPTNFTGHQQVYIPHIFTDSELSSFFRAADNIKPYIQDPIGHYIVPVIFRIIYCCGLRPNEGRNLKRQDVDLETGEIYIRESKRSKDRIVMLSEDVLQLCRHYSTLTSQTVSEYFFPHPMGMEHSKQWLDYQFRRCWRIAGVREFHGSHPRVYDFRHTFATRRLQLWMDEKRDLSTWLVYLSTYMGHSDFSSTAYYIHLMPEHLINSMAIDWSKFSDMLPEVPII